MTSLRTGKVRIIFDDPKITDVDIKRVKEDLQRFIRDNWNVAFGHLINEIYIVGNTIEMVGYAWVVSRGTKPHNAPLRALKEWAQIKFGLDEREAWAVARRVQNKIREYGTYAYRDVEDALANSYLQIREVEFIGLDTEIHVLKEGETGGGGGGEIPEDIVEFLEEVFTDDVFEEFQSRLKG